jgi:chromosome segregation ATPase
MGECGECGAPWVKVSSDFWGCSRFRAYPGKVCNNNRLTNTRLYQQRVIADLKSGMLAPEVIAAYVREYHRDYARQTAEIGKQRGRLEQKIAEADRKVRRLVEAVAEGGSEFAEIREQLKLARDTRDRLSAELASVEALPQVLTLHPNLDAQYTAEIADLERALLDEEAQLEAVPRFRAMIARVIVRPDLTKQRGVTIEVIRRIDEVLALATGIPRAQLR